MVSGVDRDGFPTSASYSELWVEEVAMVVKVLKTSLHCSGAREMTR